MELQLDSDRLRPYFGQEGSQPAMSKLRKNTAVVVLGFLCLSPFAWSCEGNETQSCSMSDCPMPGETLVSDCHQSDERADSESAVTDDGHRAWIACCESPIDNAPADFDSSLCWHDHSSFRTHLAGQIETQPPAWAQDSVAQSISSQQHKLGRFTLLSSFLL